MFLNSIQTLRHVAIDIGFHASYNNTLYPLVSEFASLAGKTAIESIRILINIPVNSGDILVNDTWCALDEVFNQSNNSGWGKLRKLSICIIVHIDYEEEGSSQADPLIEYFGELPQTHLGGVASNKNFLFNFHVSLVEVW